MNISENCDEAITDAIQKQGGSEGWFSKNRQAGHFGFIGDMSIGENEEHMFFFYPESNAVMRIDIKAYKYSFSSKRVLVKSIVGHTTLSQDELLYMMTEMAGAENADLVVVK